MFMTWSMKPDPVSPRSDSSSTSSVKELRPRVRTRNGCNTCRRRRVKCDESRPACTRCQRSKNRCSYELQLQWEDEMRTAGKCHGRTGVQSRRHSVQHPPANDGEFQLLTRARRKDMTHRQRDIGSVAIRSPPNANSPLPATPSSRVAYYTHYENWKSATTISRPVPLLPWSLGVPDVDDVCLSFYNSVMCAVGVTVDDERFNPLRSTVMRLVFRTETAYYAVLMASAHYLRSVESRFELMEIQIRSRVLRGLRRALMKEDLDWEDLLVPTIFLCSSAISNSCDGSWVKHLACFQLIVREMAHGHRNAPPVPQFFISYFSAHLVLAKSLFSIDDILPVGEIPTSPSNPNWTNTDKVSWTTTKDLVKVMPADTFHEIDVWNGLSSHMLLLINEILSLKHDAQALRHQSSDPSTPQLAVQQKHAEIRDKITTLETSLATTTQIIPVSLYKNRSSAEYGHGFRLLKSTSEAYRLAAYLLLSEAVSPHFLGYTPAPTQSLEELRDTAQRAQYVDRIFHLANYVVSSVDHLPISWPLWPLFIASCCCSRVEESRALQIFRTARDKAPYENIPRAQTLVELLWERRDMQTESDNSLRVGRFEWESAMESLGWQTSFA
ncbi:fungal-specific transcription factor domain-containing protein [Aspergillus pseudotamarii]|uniref:Fungal-specific transcription factor domain-containing protein n=1 Tax=Aspergillus pseudotamarii TaxID=132259 RepID=A0A5N6T4U4_ASPPS|nr:fungal-specific transcription factor domain-containing protein [Aspergillus pseudotamarii]KAE8141344.1 fungal-specific transcription factor domain-containing protein [Aspergillus pseudotamarii]